MKPNLVFIPLAMLLLLTTSCSRQMAGLKSTSALLTASVLQPKPTATIPDINKRREIYIDHVFTLIPEKSVSESGRPNIFVHPHVFRLGKTATAKLIMLAKGKTFNQVLSPTHTAERGDPQINKAGFILIAGGILGFLLHLILVACIIIAAIGLIVLLSPLFRKRY